jgi:hypothetical protein
MDTSYETNAAQRLDWITSDIEHYSKHLWLYHPVVVTDARLWASNIDGIEEVSVARYVRSDGIFETNRWFDLVSREYFPEYIRDVTAHYENCFHAARSKPCCESAISRLGHLW